ncbi:MAG: glycoside hydrolase [Gemmatimonadetes bacterium]|nr:glycoside hydrolase [Gemmatimonadota bacterium]
MSKRLPLLIILALLTTAAFAPPAMAQQYDADLFDEMRWRMIGPFRGSRTKAASGVASRPNVFYFGVANGGVWKTTDYGRIWRPIFDDQPTGSIGAIAVSESDPDVVYVGSGEGNQRPDLSVGDGIYKSIDAGRTWTHLGLRDGQQIPQIIIDPRNPDRLFVAVLGHPYGPNEQRGIFRSLDGGQSFQKVLYRDENTGGVDVAFDPSDVQTVYAVMWEAREGPWENGRFRGPGSGIFKSTDGGDTWRPLTAGLPTFAEDGLSRIGITVAPSLPSRLFATVEARNDGGLYRSDDSGESWYLINSDPRVTQRSSDFAEVKVHPQDPDIVFTGSIVVWKSTDGGHTFEAIRGAPGGDDYQRIWINPHNPDIMLIAADQGTIITVNGGETWSSWYNQPTAQFYHVTADNAFPYRVCGGQQESGSACVQSRGDHGQITVHEWSSVGIEEYGYAAPDPLDPDIVYGGKVTRFDRRTGQRQNVSPNPLRDGGYRVVRTMPILFSPIDPHTLYFASNVLWKTTNGGQSWDQISPDLTRETWEVPSVVGKYRGTPAAPVTRRGVIYTIAPSYKDINVIWVGTDDGLIHVTRDGGNTWTDVTPPELVPWAKVSLMDASHFDVNTAYAAINTLRLDDLRPHIYRTRDGGTSWTHITSGIPDGTIVNVVREDPQRQGLLFAGTEQTVYVSFDDGDHWQSLRLNSPATSIRDLIIKDDDVVLGTHGRAFWILDDITPLRQITPATLEADAFLFEPQQAWRFRWNKYTDTPLPPDEPVGENPPDGAIINYFLKEEARGAVTLEIFTEDGLLVRRHSSADAPEPPLEGQNVPPYWPRPPEVLSARAGLHRFVWDLHYPRPAVLRFRYPISAVVRNTPVTPKGPWVLPGRYTVRLTVDGESYTQPLTVKMDPRVQTSAAEIQRQHRISLGLYALLQQDFDAIAEVRAFRASARNSARESDAAELESDLVRINGALGSLYRIVEESDVGPTSQVVEAIGNQQRVLAETLARWQALDANRN